MCKNKGRSKVSEMKFIQIEFEGKLQKKLNEAQILKPILLCGITV
jgi:hypothetical protein